MEINIEKILKGLVKNEDLIKNHNGWGFYIQINFDAIKMIGLIENKDKLELSLFFGDSQSQSRAFYSQKIDFERLSKSDWNIITNFHLSSSYRRNLIWFKSNLKPKEYIEFWRNNIGLLYQHTIEGLPKLIETLEKENVIILDKDKKNKLDSEIYSKNYTRLNICAGFGLIFSIDKKVVDSLNEGDFSKILIEKINEGLSIINKNVDDIFIDFHDNSDFLFEEDGDPNGL